MLASLAARPRSYNSPTERFGIYLEKLMQIHYYLLHKLSTMASSAYIRKEDIDAVYNRLYPGSLKHVILTLLCNPAIPFTYDLEVTSNKKLKTSSGEIDLPEELSDLSPGLIFTKDSEPYKHQVGFVKDINVILKELFNNDKITTSRIQVPYSVSAPDIRFTVQLDQITKLTEEVDFEVNTHEFYNVFDMLTVFKVTDDPKAYPFVLVELYPYNVWIKYEIYRGLAQQPIAPRIDQQYRMPVVDHINMKPMDNRLTNLRYCTHKQNSVNACSKSVKAPYHGVTEKGFANLQNLSPDEIPLGNAVIVWMNILSTTIDKVFIINLVPAYQCIILSDSPCKPYTEIPETKVQKVDRVIRSLTNMLTTHRSDLNIYTSFVEAKSIKVSDIPEAHYADYDILPQLIECVPDGQLSVKKTLRPTCYGALINDVFRYICHGEYAHTNFLKTIPPKRTCADILKPSDLLTATEVLNMYESHYDREVVNAFYRSTGLPEEVQNKVRLFEPCDEYKYEEGYNFEHIRATFVDRDTIEHKKIDWNYIEEISFSTEITSPFTLYKL